MIFMLAAAVVPTGQPTKWQVTSAEAECVISQRWGGSDALEVRRVATEKRGRAVLTLSQPPFDQPQSGNGYLILSPERARVSVHWSSPGGAASNARQISFVADERMWELLSEATSLTLVGAGKATTLALNPREWPAGEVAACEAAALASWGVDRTAQIDSSTLPLKRWIEKRSYPAAARSANAQGRAIGLLRFDTAGAATKCDIVESAGNVDLDTATCQQLLSNAKVAQSSIKQRWALASVLWTLPS